MAANDEKTAGQAGWQARDIGVFGQMRMLIAQAVTILALTAGAYITVTAGPSLIVDFASDASSLVTAAPCVSAYDSRVEGKPWDASFAKWGYNENHFPLQLSVARDADGLSDQEFYNGKNGRPMVCLADYYRLGSLVLDVEGNRLDAAFLTEKGERLDHFTILKGK